MRVFESKIRQVGTSFGILIPKEVMREDKIKKDETVKVAILKKDLSVLEEVFGSAKMGPFKRDRKDRVF